MTSPTSKPAVKDGTRTPTPVEVEQALGLSARQARVIRGEARANGLAARVTWTTQGWVESYVHGEYELGTLHLHVTPPTVEIGVNRAFEELLQRRLFSEAVKARIANEPAAPVKWLSFNVDIVDDTDHASRLLAVKAELVKAGQLQLTAAEKLKQLAPPVARPVAAVKELPAPRPAPAAKPKVAPAPAKAAPPAKPAAVRAPPASKAKAKARPAAPAAKASRPAAVASKRPVAAKASKAAAPKKAAPAPKAAAKRATAPAKKVARAAPAAKKASKR